MERTAATEQGPIEGRQYTRLRARRRARKADMAVSDGQAIATAAAVAGVSIPHPLRLLL